MSLMESLRGADKTVNMPVLALVIIGTLVQIVSASYLGGIKTDTSQTQQPSQEQLKKEAEKEEQQKKIMDLLYEIRSNQQAQNERNLNTDRRLINIEDEVKYIRQNYQPKPGR